MKTLRCLVTFLLCFSLHSLFGQAVQPAALDTKPSAALKIDTGRIKGAMYRILIPANWNHNLVMYAHGYEVPSADPKALHSKERDQGLQVFLDKGFAVSSSAYRKKGWSLPEGVEDTEALRQFFVKKYGKPDTAFIVGHSMGGGVTVATVENFAKHYQGALPLCPLAGRPYLQIKRCLDLVAVFNVLYPNLLPPLSKILDGTAAPLNVKALVVALKQDTVAAAQLANNYELKAKDLPQVLFFNCLVLRDVAKQAGGNPLDNTNTVYSGLPTSWDINRKVERVSAKPGTQWFFSRYDRTGNIVLPTVLMHTTYDQLIPPSMSAVALDNLATQKGKQDNLVILYTKGQGHCNFTPEETSQAFGQLRRWAATHQKPKPGPVY